MKKVYLFILFIILLQTNGIAASWKYSKIKQASVYQAQVCYAQCLATYLRQQDNVWTWNTGNAANVNDETWFSNNANGSQSQFFVLPSTVPNGTFQPTKNNASTNGNTAIISPPSLNYNFTGVMFPKPVTSPSRNLDCSNYMHVNALPISHDDIDDIMNNIYFSIENYADFEAANWNDRRILYNRLYPSSAHAADIDTTNLTLENIEAIRYFNKLDEEHKTAALADSTIGAWYKEIANNSIGRFKQIDDEIESGNFADAINLNNDINAILLPEQWQQAYNTIYLNHLLCTSDSISDTICNYTATEINTLINIAAQCPLTGGTATYQARALLDAEHIAYNANDDELCIFSSSQARMRNGINELLHYEQLAIQPNPTTDNTTIEIKGNEEIAECMITDIAGKKIDCIVGNKSEEANRINIDVKCLANGFYTVRVKSKTNKIYYGKLIKQ